MQIVLNRYDKGPNDTIGQLSIDGKFFCYTIEDEVREGAKVHGETAIPYGSYKLGKRHSPKFSPIYGHDMLWLLDVKNFQYVLIHPGNTDSDTEGCILVGASLGSIKGKRAILNSKPTYLKLYKIISDAMAKGDVYITIS